MKPTDDSASGRLSAALLLLYYIQGNYAAIYDKPLFDAPFVPLKESALPLWEKYYHHLNLVTWLFLLEEKLPLINKEDLFV